MMDTLLPNSCWSSDVRSEDTLQPLKKKTKPPKKENKKTGAALIRAYDEYYQQFSPRRNPTEAIEAKEVEEQGTQEEACRERNASNRLSDFTCTDATWRAAKLREFQGRKHASRLAYQEIKSDLSIHETRKLLAKLIASKCKPLHIAPSPLPQGSQTASVAKKHAQMQNYTNKETNQWTDPGGRAVKTVIQGVHHLSSVTVETAKSTEIPAWATAHMLNLRGQILEQKRTEAQAMESMERTLMYHEESCQRHCEAAMRACEECDDFVEFLRLVHKFGPVPDWRVFGFGQEQFGRLPGRRYGRMILRSALKIQRSWQVYWPRRLAALTRAARMLQRVYRGHVGRVDFAKRIQLLENVNRFIKRMRGALQYKCFRSWEIYCDRSKKVKGMMRKALRRDLASAFLKFTDIIEGVFEARQVKVELQLAKSALRRQTKVFDLWREYSSKCHRVRLFAARILQGAQSKVFRAWRDHKNNMGNMRETLARRCISECFQRVVSKVSEDRTRLFCILSFQSIVRGHQGRKRALYHRQKLQRAERQQHRKWLQQLERKQEQERLNQVLAEKKRMYETLLSVGEPLLEKEIVDLDKVNSRKTLEASTGGPVTASALACFNDWWFENVETAEMYTKRTKTFMGRLQSWSKKGILKKHELKGLCHAKNRVKELLPCAQRQGARVIAFQMEHLKSLAAWDVEGCENLLVLWGKERPPLAKSAHLLSKILSSVGQGFIAEHDVTNMFATFEALLSAKADPKPLRVVYLHEALMQTVQPGSWYHGAWLEQLWVLALKDVRQALEFNELEMLTQKPWRDCAVKSAIKRLAAIRMQSIARSFLAKCAFNRLIEARSLLQEDLLAQKVRLEEKEKILQLRRTCIRAAAKGLWDKASRQGLKMSVFLRLRAIKNGAATKIQRWIRIYLAKESLHFKIVDTFDKLWDSSSRAYYYVDKRSGAFFWTKPALLKYVFDDDIPTPRSKQRDLYARPLYLQKHHDAAIKIQGLARRTAAKSVVHYLWNQQYRQRHYYYQQQHYQPYYQQQQYQPYYQQQQYQQQQGNYQPHYQQQQYQHYQNQQLHYPPQHQQRNYRPNYEHQQQQYQWHYQN